MLKLMIKNFTIFLLLVLVPVAKPQGPAGPLTVRGEFNATATTRSRPAKHGSSDPANCLPGEKFFNTTSALFKSCLTTDTWSTEGLGAAASGFSTSATTTVITNTAGKTSLNGVVTSISSTGTITKNSGTDTGTFYVYVDYNSGTPVRKCVNGTGTTIGNYTVSSGFSGSTCLSGTGFPSGLGIFPLGTVPVTSGSFGTVTDLRSDIDANVYTFSSGLTETSGAVTVDATVVLLRSTDQAGTDTYAAATSSSATVYTASLTPALGAYVTGQRVLFNVGSTACTGSTTTTLSLNGLTGIPIKLADGSTNPTSGDCPANRLLILSYDGTNFRILGGGVNSSSSSTTTLAEMTAEYPLPWIINSSYPIGYRTRQNTDSANCGGGGSTAATGEDIIATSLQSPSATNDYCYIFPNLDTGTASRYPDWVATATFRPFVFRGRWALASTANVISRLGAFSSVSSTTPQGVYLQYDSSANANWRCIVNDGSATNTDTGVAATTSMITFEISATAAGTLTCKVNGTSVSAVDTFTSATFWGGYIQTLTTASKAFTVSNLRVYFSGLSR